MALDPVTAISDVIGKVIDRAWPDPVEAAKAKLALEELESKGELAIVVGQLDVNKVEAGSGSLFVAGARPFVMWVCGISLGYVSLIEPLARFIAMVGFQYSGAFPVINTDLTMQVLLGLLGLGGLRSWDKKNGVASTSIGKG